MAYSRIRKIVLTSVLTATLLLAGCHEPNDGEAGDGGSDDGDIRMGALMPLTGDAASLGIPAMNGARLAVQEINDAGGIDGSEVVLVEGDTEFPKTENTVAAFERVASEDVAFIVGALASDSSDAIKSHANEREIVLMSPASTAPELTGPDHGFFFRTIANDDVQGPQAAQLVAEDLGVDEVVVMYQQTGYAQGLKDTFIEAYSELGGTVDGDAISWQNDAATFEAKAAEAVQRGTDFIWISGQAPEIANLISALRDQGFEGDIMTSEAIEADSIFDVAEEDVDGVLFTKTAPDPEDPTYVTFRDAYMDAYGSNPGPFDAFAYDAVYVGAAAIEAVGNDGPAIKDWLEGASVSGRVTTDTISFNNEGDITTGGYSLWAISYEGGEGSFAPYRG